MKYVASDAVCYELSIPSASICFCCQLNNIQFKYSVSFLRAIIFFWFLFFRFIVFHSNTEFNRRCLFKVVNIYTVFASIFYFVHSKRTNKKLNICLYSFFSAVTDFLLSILNNTPKTYVECELFSVFFIRCV